MGAGDDLLQYLIVPTRASLDTSVKESNSVPEDWSGRHQAQSRDGSSSNPRAEEALPAETSRMEVDTQPGALPGQILSMEEFMTQRRLSEQAVLQSQSQSQAQPAPEPRVISARSSKNTIELHEKYQALGIPRPEFVFQGGSVEGWVVKTVFLGRELSVQEPCGSKQEVKEKLSEICLEVVKEMEEAGQLAKTPKTKKQKRGAEEPAVTHAEKEESSINYIGQLLEYQRSIGTPQPTYTDFQLGQSFSCEVTLESHPHPFGSRTTFFTSKRAARHHAAACAVKHFQSTGTWPTTFTDVGGIRKKRSIPTPSIPSPSSKLDTPGTTATATASSSSSSSPSSFAHRVASLATQLSLPTPEWRFTPSSTSAPGFHTVSCFFRDGGPHEGPIGEVRNVFGKKKAKEECARGVLEYLQGVKEKRLEYARGVVEGMRGDVGGVVGRGVGREVEGEGEREMDEGSEDGFVSAVEEVE